MINKVILLGNVGGDPDVRTMPNGSKVCNFSLATSESWKDKDGTRKDKTEWHRIVVYNDNLVQVLSKYVKKGSKLYIEGSIKSRKYTDSSGTEKFVTEIVIQGYGDTIKIVDSKSSGSNDGESESSGDSNNFIEKKEPVQSSGEKSFAGQDIDDEIPF